MRAVLKMVRGVINFFFLATFAERCRFHCLALNGVGGVDSTRVTAVNLAPYKWSNSQCRETSRNFINKIVITGTVV